MPELIINSYNYSKISKFRNENCVCDDPDCSYREYSASSKSIII